MEIANTIITTAALVIAIIGDTPQFLGNRNGFSNPFDPEDSGYKAAIDTVLRGIKHYREKSGGDIKIVTSAMAGTSMAAIARLVRDEVIYENGVTLAVRRVANQCKNWSGALKLWDEFVNQDEFIVKEAEVSKETFGKAVDSRDVSLIKEASVVITVGQSNKLAWLASVAVNAGKTVHCIDMVGKFLPTPKPAVTASSPVVNMPQPRKKGAAVPAPKTKVDQTLAITAKVVEEVPPRTTEVVIGQQFEDYDPENCDGVVEEVAVGAPVIETDSSGCLVGELNFSAAAQPPKVATASFL